MTMPAVFESQDIWIEGDSKTLINGEWRSFQWVPGLTVNGETCISVNTITFEDGNISELGNKNELVEVVRLSGIEESLKHYAAI